MQMIVMDTDLLRDRGGMPPPLPPRPPDSLLTVDIIFKHKGRKDRRAAVAKAIAVVREKGELRECLLDLQWKMNEQRSRAKLLLFLFFYIFSPLFDQPAAMAPFIFFSFFLSFFSFAVNLLERIGRRGDLCRREELWWKAATSHSLEVLIPSKFKLFLGHQRKYWKKKPKNGARVMQQVLWDFFYINSRLGLLCNSWYSDFFHWLG